MGLIGAGGTPSWLRGSSSEFQSLSSHLGRGGGEVWETKRGDLNQHRDVVRPSKWEQGGVLSLEGWEHVWVPKGHIYSARPLFPREGIACVDSGGA